MADSLTETVRLVDIEASRLKSFLAGLDEAQWSRASSCEGWTVADVAAHLSAGANTWANSIGRAVDGDSGPPEGQTPLASGDRGSNVISQSAISYRQEAGSKLMENFCAACSGRCEGPFALRPIAANGPARPAPHWPGQEPSAISAWN